MTKYCRPNSVLSFIRVILRKFKGHHKLSWVQVCPSANDKQHHSKLTSWDNLTYSHFWMLLNQELRFPVNTCKIAADYLQVACLALLPPGQVRVSANFLGLPALELSLCGIPNHHHFNAAPIIGTSLSVISTLTSSSSLKLHFYTARNLLSLYLLIKTLSSCCFLPFNV